MRRTALAFVSFLILIACAWPGPAAAEETLSYVDLVRRMTDLERLAELPAAGERNAMCSSYDRRSRYDAQSGRYVEWFANNDGPQFIRTEGSAVVLAEMEGPGVLWRIWSALAEKGHVKIFLDGSDVPAIDMPFEHYFDGKHAPFDYSTLAYQLEDVGCRGRDLYFPVPYQKSCKVVAEEGWGRYYQFTYTTLPPGTVVPTFTTELSEEAIAALREVDRFYRNRLGSDPAGRRPDQKRVKTTVRAAAGELVEVARLEGPQAITGLIVRIDFADRQDEMDALRELALQIRFDGQEEPAVWCPLGDFFGTAPGVNHYKSLPMGMTEEGFYSFWYMPFARDAVVELSNDGRQPRELDFAITHAPLGRAFDGLGHFHCKWHRDVLPVSEDRWPDWTVLKAEGRGRFCGMMLHVWSPRGGHHAAAGEGHWWWGEGDEKFFVDGEKFPSTFGTGTEDYFGYAWCHPGLFQRPYHNQTMTERNAGHQSVNRWQIVDNVPFQKSFEGYLEKYFPNDRPTRYACTACWYLAPGGADPFGPVPVAERLGYYDPAKVAEGGFRVLGHAYGNIVTQDMSPFPDGKWAGGDQLWWTGAEEGDKLNLELAVDSPGRKRLAAVLTKGKNYAIVQLWLDGRKLGEPIDLYSPRVEPTAPVPLGAHELEQGSHKLTIEIVGANPSAGPGRLFGIDQVVLEPAE